MTSTVDQSLTGPIDHMVFVHIDQDLLLATGRSQGVGLIEAKSRQLIRIVAGGVPVTALVPLPGRPHGDWLLVGGPNGQIREINPANGHQSRALNSGLGEVRDFAVGTDAAGQEIVVVARDSGLSLWPTAGDDLHPLTDDLNALPARPFRVCLYRSAGRPFVACALTDGSLATWNLSEPEAAPLVIAAHSGPVWTIITIPGEDDRTDLVATGGSDQSLRVWEPTESGQLHQRRSYLTGGTIRRLGHVAEAGVRLLVTASARGPVSLWRYDGPAERPVAEVALHSGEVYSVACETLPDAIVVASGDFNGDFLINRLTSNILIHQSMRRVARVAATIWAVTSGVADFGEFYACAGVNRMVYIIDPVTQAVRHTLAGHDSTVRALSFAGDATAAHLLSGSADHTVIDWDPVTGTCRAVLAMGHEAEVWAITSVHNGGRQYAISGGPDGTVRTCDLSSPDRARVLARDIGEVSSLAVVTTGDQAYVLAGSTQGLYRIPLLGGEANEISKDPVAALATLPDTHTMAVVVRPDGSVELYDPIAGVLLKRFGMPLSNRQVRAVAIHRTAQGDPLVFGGCDNGDVLTWDIDGHLIGTPSKGGETSVRSLAVTIGDGRGPAGLLGAGHDGVLRHWPISEDRPLSSGGSLDSPVRPTSVLLQDQPAESDLLARTALTDTLVAALTSAETAAPVVVGIHAPWGQGKSSILRQVRAAIDPYGSIEDASDKVVQTHRLVDPDGAEVITDITPTWAWRRLQQRASETRLPYRMIPTSARTTPITAWLNPWMYEERGQIWAGLTNEILTAITRRLPAAQRQRLFIDLNLKRSDAASVRKQILDSYRPSSLRGLVFLAAAALTLVAAVVATMVALVNTGQLSKIIPGAVVIFFVSLWVIIRFVASGVKGFKIWYNPLAANGPRMGGIGAPDPASQDPLEAPDRGYLYLLRHDVREVIDLAKDSPLYIFIDDMDRCSPAVVADTIEAINLFLTKAFGPCIFVMGLDPATVAAHLESHLPAIGQRAQEDPVTYRQLRHMGWRFMEKIVDLPIRLPRVTDIAMRNYLDRLLLTSRTPVPEPAREKRPDFAASSTFEPTTDPRPEPTSDAASEGARSEPYDSATQPLPSRPLVRTRAGRRTRAPRRAQRAAIPQQRPADDPAPAPIGSPDQRMEDIPVVRDALHEAVQNLPGRNPRQIKAFVNLWRFYMALEHHLGVTTSSLSGTQVHSAEMARLVEIMVRWPWLLDPLGARRTYGGRQTNLLGILQRAARDEQDWYQAVEREGIDANDEDIRGLRELLQRHGTDGDELVAIAARYL